MRRLFVPVVFAFLLTAFATSCGDDSPSAPTNVKLADGNSGSTVTVAKDATITVSLTSNPSTGFRWAARAPVPSQVQMQGEPRFIMSGSGPPVGAPGTEVFTFRAVGQGTATLTLDYARSFEPGVPPLKSWTVTIVVK